jgi:hypothetical protein
MDDYYKIEPPSFAYLWVSINFTKPLPQQPVTTVKPTVTPSTARPRTTELTTTKPKTESIVTPKEAVPEEPASPETLMERYKALEKMVQEERIKPKEKQNYTEIKNGLKKIAENKNEAIAARKAARYAKHVLRQIKDLELVLAVGKEVRLQNEQLKTIREKIKKSRAARQAKFKDMSSYAVIGEILPFTTYGPGNYRIVDESGKTICYAKPNGPISQIEITKFFDQKVGLVGTIEPHRPTKGSLVRFTKIVKLD